jgi:hypothetical protein
VGRAAGKDNKVTRTPIHLEQFDGKLLQLQLLSGLLSSFLVIVGATPAFEDLLTYIRDRDLDQLMINVCTGENAFDST